MEDCMNDHTAFSRDPAVSVVIAFYNAQKYLRETIESVLAQTYQDWEMLLVDDGSSDQGTVIAQEYARKFPQKIRFLEHPGHQNIGAAAARNLGFKHVRGRYIALLDADDVWLPHKLSDQVKLMEKYSSAGMVCGGVLQWWEWDEKRPQDRHDVVYPTGGPQNALTEPPKLFEHLYPLQKGMAPTPSDLLIRREVIERVGGFEEIFKKQFQLYDDQSFLSKVYLFFPVYVSSEVWIKYRRHCESCVATVRGSGQYDQVRKFFLNWFKSYLDRNGFRQTEVWFMLQKSLLPYRHPIARKFFKLMGGVNSRGLLTEGQDRKTLIGSIKKIFVNAKSPESILGSVEFGSLRRVTPLSRKFGYDRGGPIDRYYIENFLEDRKNDVRGRVLEIKNNVYTKRFGADRVQKSDILDISPDNPNATIIADLTQAAVIESNSYDCVILTQVLQLIYDCKAAIQTIHRILKPGGVLLLTVPGITQIAYQQLGKTWYWSFSEASVKRILAESFGEENVNVSLHGNVLAATGFLYGLGSQELKKEEFDFTDPDYQVIVSVRAMKSQLKKL